MKPIGATLLRIILGIIFATHGYEGYFVLTGEGTTSFTSIMGLPLGRIAAWYLVLAHAVGGIMLIAGLWTRWAAAANVPVMLATIAMFHFQHGFFMTGVIVDAVSGSADAVGMEYPLLVLVATVAQVFLGGGALAMTQDR